MVPVIAALPVVEPAVTCYLGGDDRGACKYVRKLGGLTEFRNGYLAMGCAECSLPQYPWSRAG